MQSDPPGIAAADPLRDAQGAARIRLDISAERLGTHGTELV